LLALFDDELAAETDGGVPLAGQRDTIVLPVGS
jgi:hypothetical protein